MTNILKLLAKGCAQHFRNKKADSLAGVGLFSYICKHKPINNNKNESSRTNKKRPKISANEG